MYTYKLGISAQEHDDFVKHHPQANLLQSASWAKIKDNWGNERVGFYQDGKLVASASILIRPLPFGMSMFYIPRGPVMDYSNQELLAFVFSSLKKFAKQKRALFIKFDPNLRLKEGLIGEEVADNPETLAIINQLQQLGAVWTGRTSSLDETIQPRFHAVIRKEHFKEDKLSKSTKQALRTARNKGIDIIFGGEELLDDFTGLMKKTEARKQISLRGRDYYAKMLATYPGHSYLTMARLDIPKRLDSLQAALDKNQQEAASFTEKTRQTKVDNNYKEKERLEKEIAFLTDQLQPDQTNLPLAATLTLEYGTTSENIYAGMNEDFRAYQPAMLTWYHTAEHAFERGGSWQNMGGIENNLDGGLFQFKSRFNPVIEEYVGEFNLPTSFLYHLSNYAYTLRKKLRSKKH